MSVTKENSNRTKEGVVFDTTCNVKSKRFIGFGANVSYKWFPLAAVGETRAFNDPGAQCGTWLSGRGVTVPTLSLSERRSSCPSALLGVFGFKLTT